MDRACHVWVTLNCLVHRHSKVWICGVSFRQAFCFILDVDGKTFRELPVGNNTSGTDGFYVQTLSGAAVKVIHIRTSTGGFFSTLREVSLFR